MQRLQCFTTIRLFSRNIVFLLGWDVFGIHPKPGHDLTIYLVQWFRLLHDTRGPSIPLLTGGFNDSRFQMSKQASIWKVAKTRSIPPFYERRTEPVLAT